MKHSAKTEYEPRHEKTGFFSYAKTKRQISCAVTAQLISAFVFAIQIVQFLYYLNPKFQASSHLLWLYSPVCVRPGRKPRRPVFSQQGSYTCWHYFCLLYDSHFVGFSHADSLLIWYVGQLRQFETMQFFNEISC